MGVVVYLPISTKTVKVRDHLYTVRLLSKEHYFSLHNDDSRAITLLDKKEIHINNEHEVTLGTVIHEVFHAYCNTLYLNSAELDQIQTEEIIAEMLEDHIANILKQSINLFKLLKKY